jgi:PilZ domain
MEHRWGERVELRLTVELSSGSSLPVAGSMVNVSSSGAFVRTTGRRPPRGPVEVTFAEPGSDRGRVVQLPGYVVRESSTGVGIEWSQFAPRVVRELLVRDRRAGAARALLPIRRSPRGASMTMQPRALSAAEPVAMGPSTLPSAESAAPECGRGPVDPLPIRRPVLESTIGPCGFAAARQ